MDQSRRSIRTIHIKISAQKNIDAALLMAYAQAKLCKFNQSKDTIQKLLKTYEKTISERRC